jgi:nucleotide-binding universal stress UspA family protein
MRDVCQNARTECAFSQIEPRLASDGSDVAISNGMPFRKILCPTDFSPGSQSAMRIGVRLAASHDAELVVLHAWHMSLASIAGAGETLFPADFIGRMIEEEERGLAAAASEAAKLGARRVSTRFLTGVPWDQIVETLSADAMFDLVVMGTHGRTGIGRVLLGSVAEKVIRHAPCSVLAVRPRGESAAFAQLLCPVDFSDDSRRAVERAAELAAPSGASITLLHVIEPPVTYTGNPPVSDLLGGIDKQSTHLLVEWASDLTSRFAIPVATEIRIGSPGSQTLDLLHKHPDFDLVVLGSHGRTGIRRVLLGSVAEKVVRHAACSVLVTRSRTA